MPTLRDQNQPHIADVLEQAAHAFCEALAEHRRSPAYRGRLVPPVALGLEAVLVELHAAADVLDGKPEELEKWATSCRHLARRLEELAQPGGPHPVLVLVSVDRLGMGELVMSASVNQTTDAATLAPGAPVSNSVVQVP